MKRPIGAQIAFMVRYYQKMHWTLHPWFILELYAEECYDDDSDFAWRTLRDAIVYLKEQAGVEL